MESIKKSYGQVSTIIYKNILFKKENIMKDIQEFKAYYEKMRQEIKRKTINIQISSKDMKEIEKKADKNNVSIECFISYALHNMKEVK
ncbi:MAG: Unknown protein [uncultured Campylobacterales bacterium]|uniref:Uncharacterized protein n=1 Tax=uncultured Campylobacterales bacterium TaxID=352960 RepID=A0A6S6TF71_9BACT|nr:MAG: Unknown protein [uncultured Campylobacterales bacterium]